jgi:hypothetical protein
MMWSYLESVSARSLDAMRLFESFGWAVLGLWVPSDSKRDASHVAFAAWMSKLQISVGVAWDESPAPSADEDMLALLVLSM